MLTVAIVGRPNVGKSTLFNRLCGKKIAITHDMPGVTRDVKRHEVEFFGMRFWLLDTAGLDIGAPGFANKMTEHAMLAASNADLLLWVIDATTGVVPQDLDTLAALRRYGKPVLLIANKAESKKRIDESGVYALGLGEPIYIAAEHGLGMVDLAESMAKFLPEDEPEEKVLTDVKIAFFGRPNVGKSSLFNALLGSATNMVDDQAGTTRDAISHYLAYKEYQLELIDTAGMRRKKNIDDSLEKMATGESISAVRRAHVVVLVIDVNHPLESQEITLLELAIKEGKAVVLAINKIDTLNKKQLQEYKGALQHVIDKHLFDLNGIEVVWLSALKQQNINALLPAVMRAQSLWRKEISTARLNKLLQMAVANHVPPTAKNGRRLRFKYITQVATKPPSFAIFSNLPQEVPTSYTRYLIGVLRQQAGLAGIPIRIFYRQVDNPYANNKR